MKRSSLAAVLAMPLLILLAACSGGNSTETVSESALADSGPLEEKWLGEESAPVTIIEYASMTCPHCQNFHMTVYDTLIADYVDTGIVRFSIREFPLDIRAAAGFMLARCAQGENGYYSMVDLLFENQGQWAGLPAEGGAFLDGLFALVEQRGFTRESFNACLDDAGLEADIWETYERGVELGVEATPTFFINGRKYSGALTLAQLQTAIEEAQ